MYRKAAFEKVGGYPEIYRIEDIVYFNKLAKIGELCNLPDVLIKYRLCPTAVTAKSSKKDYKIIENIIILDAVNDKIIEEQKNILKSITMNRDSNYKTAIYYLHLAKKYLWNNYQPKLSRENLIKSLKIKFNKEPIFYYFVSFLPERLIQKLYRKLKVTN